MVYGCTIRDAEDGFRLKSLAYSLEKRAADAAKELPSRTIAPEVRASAVLSASWERIIEEELARARKTLGDAEGALVCVLGGLYERFPVSPSCKWLLGASKRHAAVVPAASINAIARTLYHQRGITAVALLDAGQRGWQQSLATGCSLVDAARAVGLVAR